jgi:rhodanese-related sulfurtransferase
VSGPFQRLSPRELAQRIRRGEALQLVDVREPFEWAICRIEGSRLIPRGELARRSSELDPGRPVVLICHHGVRSAMAAAWLGAQGFEAVFDLAGGIDAWSLDVDPALPRYG